MPTPLEYVVGPTVRENKQVAGAYLGKRNGSMFIMSEDKKNPDGFIIRVVKRCQPGKGVVSKALMKAARRWRKDHPRDLKPSEQKQQRRQGKAVEKLMRAEKRRRFDILAPVLQVLEKLRKQGVVDWSGHVSANMRGVAKGHPNFGTPSLYLVVTPKTPERVKGSKA
jgi:hypothetical protein